MLSASKVDQLTEAMYTVSEMLEDYDNIYQIIECRNRAPHQYHLTDKIILEGLEKENTKDRQEIASLPSDPKNKNAISVLQKYIDRKGVKEFLEKDSVSLIVSRGECRLKFMRDARHKGIKVPVYEIDKKKCIKCGTCLYKFACPAIQRVGIDGDFFIDPDLCWGCSVCGQICPSKAISPRVEKK